GPAMRGGALKVQAVSGLEPVPLASYLDLQLATQNEQELFPFVGVGFAAACLGSNAKQMRLHYRIAPGQQFHADARAGFQDLAALGGNQPAIAIRRVEKIEDAGLVEARQPAQRAYRCAHVGTLHRAEKALRN